MLCRQRFVCPSPPPSRASHGALEAAGNRTPDTALSLFPCFLPSCGKTTTKKQKKQKQTKTQQEKLQQQKNGSGHNKKHTLVHAAHFVCGIPPLCKSACAFSPPLSHIKPKLGICPCARVCLETTTPSFSFLFFHSPCRVSCASVRQCCDGNARGPGARSFWAHSSCVRRTRVRHTAARMQTRASCSPSAR